MGASRLSVKSAIALGDTKRFVCYELSVLTYRPTFWKIVMLYLSESQTCLFLDCLSMKTNTFAFGYKCQQSAFTYNILVFNHFNFLRTVSKETEYYTKQAIVKIMKSCILWEIRSISPGLRNPVII